MACERSAVQLRYSPLKGKNNASAMSGEHDSGTLYALGYVKVTNYATSYAILRASWRKKEEKTKKF